MSIEVEPGELAVGVVEPREVAAGEVVPRELAAGEVVPREVAAVEVVPREAPPEPTEEMSLGEDVASHKSKKVPMVSKRAIVDKAIKCSSPAEGKPKTPRKEEKKESPRKGKETHTSPALNKERSFSRQGSKSKKKVKLPKGRKPSPSETKAHHEGSGVKPPSWRPKPGPRS